jgi:hypothetical protein
VADFHPAFNLALRNQIAVAVEPDYVVRVERRVYVAGPDENEDHFRHPDVSIVLSDRGRGFREASEQGGVAVAPVECLIPEPEEHRETYLVIRPPGAGEVNTVIETLSPANKQRASNGRKEYLRKRDAVLDSPTHLVELDLLRGGARLPIDGRPPGDYFAMVSRAHKRPKIDVYAWSLRQSIPPIRIPLARGDDEPFVDLQQAVDSVYDSARYQLTLDYAAPLQPPGWMKEIVG